MTVTVVIDGVAQQIDEAAFQASIPPDAAAPVPMMASKLWLMRVLRRIAVGAASAKAALDSAVAAQPAELQEDLANAIEIARSEALIEVLRIAWGWTPEQVDAVWRAAATTAQAMDSAAADADLQAAGFTLV